MTCHTCKSPDTILDKDHNTRLYFLQCEVCIAAMSGHTGSVAQCCFSLNPCPLRAQACGSKCSVASINAGFQAVTGKRSQLRNKQEEAK